MNSRWRGSGVRGDVTLGLVMVLCCWLCAWPGRSGYPVISWAPEAGLCLMVAGRAHRMRAAAMAMVGATVGYSLSGNSLIHGGLAALMALTAGWTCRVLFHRLERVLGRPVARLIVAAGVASAAVAGVEMSALALSNGHLNPNDFRYAIVNLVARCVGLLIIGFIEVLPQARISRDEYPRAPFTRAVQPVLLAVLSAVIFTSSSYPLKFLPMLLIIWGAVLLPLRMLQIELLALTLLVSYASQRGSGAFILMDSAFHSPDLARVEVGESFNLSVTVVGLVLAVYVASSRVQARALKESALLHQEMLDASVVGMMIVSRSQGATGRFTQVQQTNLIAREMFGIDDAPVATSHLLERIAPEDQEKARSKFLEVVNGASSRETVDFWLQVGSDGWRRISTTMTSMGGEGCGEPEHISFQLIDVTQQHAVESELTKRALHDPLTGLGNRTLLEDRMAYWRDINGRQSTCSLVVYVDLDAFKSINDTHGHDVGDEVLMEVARRMQSVVRPQDTVVRLGGDEFVVLMPELPIGKPEIFDQMAARIQEAVCRPMQMAWGELPIGASFGTAVSDARTSQDALLRRADKSMYAAKAQNRLSRIPAQRVSPTVSTPAQPVIGMGEVRTALRESQFELFVQPLVDLPSRRILGGEALIRWHHPSRGLLGPDAWLGLVEGSDLSGELGSWVIGESCRIAAQWRDALGADSPVMHANVSATQLGNGVLLNDVRTALRETGLLPEKLVIELTETQLELSPAVVSTEIGALRETGVALAADDFGTGYSSLTRLTDMPIDIMKIDRTFVGRMAEDERARAVVAAVLAMGNELGLEVVAEGVETESQAIDLREMGCTVAQGFLWSKAIRADEFLRLAEAHSAEGLTVASAR